jgi:hypothetical protein
MAKYQKLLYHLHLLLHYKMLPPYILLLSNHFFLIFIRGPPISLLIFLNF